jgi:hypothetical protein
LNAHCALTGVEHVVGVAHYHQSDSVVENGAALVWPYLRIMCAELRIFSVYTFMAIEHQDVAYVDGDDDVESRVVQTYCACHSKNKVFAEDPAVCALADLLTRTHVSGGVAAW